VQIFLKQMASNDRLSSHFTQCVLLHYLGKTYSTKKAFESAKNIPTLSIVSFCSSALCNSLAVMSDDLWSELKTSDISGQCFI